MPRIVEQKSKKSILDRAREEYPIVDDMKLRMSLIKQTDRWNDYAREMILKTYQDNKLLLIYKEARDVGNYQHGGETKVRREVMRFPNGFVYNYCKAVFEPKYGPGWEINPKVWRHELIRPWLLIRI